MIVDITGVLYLSTRLINITKPRDESVFSNVPFNMDTRDRARLSSVITEPASRNMKKIKFIYSNFVINTQTVPKTVA